MQDMVKVNSSDTGGSRLWSTLPRVHHDALLDGRDWAAPVWRFRVLRAMADVVAERGLRKASLAEVTRRASVSHRVFVELFGSFDGCMQALLDWALERICGLIGEAAERESCWQDRVMAGLEVALLFLDSEPTLARACLLEVVASPPEHVHRRDAMFECLRALIDGVREDLSLERQPPAVTAEAAIISVLGLLRGRLLEGKAPPFLPLLGPLAEAIIAPYLGPSAASEASRRGRARAQVLVRTRCAPGAGGEVQIPAMLRHANAHRLRSCLVYVAENPGTSNKAIAAAVGISHLGQVSTLLARLYQAKLLEKRAGGAGRPNAWSLSSSGAEIARALSS